MSLYDAGAEVVRIGDLNGFLTFSTETYGIAIGDAAHHLTYDPVNGLVISGMITVNDAVGIEINEGGGMVLRGSDTDPATISWVGTYTSCNMATVSDGQQFIVWPDISSGVSVHLGVRGTPYLGVSDRLLGSFFVDCSANVIMTAGSGDTYYATLSCGSAAASFEVQDGSDYYAFTLAAGVGAIVLDDHKTLDMGTSGGAFKDMYADNFNNVADFPFFDEHDDLKAIAGIESLAGKDGTPVRDPASGNIIINDDTLPEWLVAKHTKDTANHKMGDIARTKDGKPYIPLKNGIALAWGAIKQLQKETDDRISGIESQLKEAIDAISEIRRVIELNTIGGRRL
jgi:hypothetical protein